MRDAKNVSMTEPGGVYLYGTIATDNLRFQLRIQSVVATL